MSRQPVTLVAAEADHVAPIARALRAIDRRECAAMGQSGEDALRTGLRQSAQVWTAMVAGEPHAMFGVVVPDDPHLPAVPWFLGTEVVMRHARALLRLGPGLVAQMRPPGRALVNCVSADNAAAIGLLQRWGFTVDTDHLFVGDMPFRRFCLDGEIA